VAIEGKSGRGEVRGAGEMSTGGRADDIGRKQQSKQLLVIYLLLANDSKQGGGEEEQKSQKKGKRSTEVPNGDRPFVSYFCCLFIFIYYNNNNTVLPKCMSSLTNDMPQSCRFLLLNRLTDCGRCLLLLLPDGERQEQEKGRGQDEENPFLCEIFVYCPVAGSCVDHDGRRS
jgi:hypothetical protein